VVFSKDRLNILNKETAVKLPRFLFVNGIGEGVDGAISARMLKKNLSIVQPSFARQSWLLLLQLLQLNATAINPGYQPVGTATMNYRSRSTGTGKLGIFGENIGIFLHGKNPIFNKLVSVSNPKSLCRYWALLRPTCHLPKCAVDNPSPFIRWPSCGSVLSSPRLPGCV